MIIAVPVNGALLSQHFGRCQTYSFFETDDNSREIVDERNLVPPAHEPGVLPAWIAEMGGNVVITGGMGPRAIQIFEQNQIAVVLGAPSVAPRTVVESYLAGELLNGQSSCDHGSHGDGVGHSCR